jgi:hypothetical protein
MHDLETVYSVEDEVLIPDALVVAGINEALSNEAARDAAKAKERR